MKIILISIVSISLLFLQCQTEKSGQNQPENKTTNSMQKNDSTKKIDDIEITYSVNLAEMPKITINYEMKNLGLKNYVVFNQGHTNIAKENDAYIEERNGVIEVSQKAFAPPAGIPCPPTIAPIFPRGSLLAANASLKGKAVIEKMQTHTPYDFCNKDAIKEVSSAKVNFCLGIVEGGADLIDENGTAKDRDIVNRQKILCSDEIALK